jgi:very-short-patch-repair endonuclease
MSDAESRLWYTLRRHGLEGFKFRRQHPLGPFILDFYCAQARLVVEIDGGQHFDKVKSTQDAERTMYLEERGLRVLRFSNREALLETDSLLDQILEALKTPLPNPLPRGARGQCDNGT